MTGTTRRTGRRTSRRGNTGAGGNSGERLDGERHTRFRKNCRGAARRVASRRVAVSRKARRSSVTQRENERRGGSGFQRCARIKISARVACAGSSSFLCRTRARASCAKPVLQKSTYSAHFSKRRHTISLSFFATSASSFSFSFFSSFSFSFRIPPLSPSLSLTAPDDSLEAGVFGSSSNTVTSWV